MSVSGRIMRLSPWGRLVAASAVIVLGVAVTLGAWSVASSHERRVQYAVRGAVTAITLDLGDADVVVERAARGASVSVEHVDRYGFGHDAEAQRSVSGGVFRVRSRCPHDVLHDCRIRYRIRIPDNLPLTVRTSSGAVALRGYRGSASIMSGGGDIDVRDFCGFWLRAESNRGGDVSASTSCPLPQLSLRTTSGNVHARVPAGRYRVDASTPASATIRGIAATTDAPFSIQALSSSGDVVVEHAP